jgi:hypothetical protein
MNRRAKNITLTGRSILAGIKRKRNGNRMGKIEQIARAMWLRKTPK